MAENSLVQLLTSQAVLSVSSQKEVRRVLKRQKAELAAVLGSDTEFLLTQLEPGRLEILLSNLARHCRDPALLVPCLHHLCSAQLLPHITR